MARSNLCMCSLLTARTWLAGAHFLPPNRSVLHEMHVPLHSPLHIDAAIPPPCMSVCMQVITLAHKDKEINVMSASFGCSSLFLSLLLLASFLCTVHGGDRKKGYVEADVRSLLLSESCSSQKVSAPASGRSTVKVSHRYGPCSPRGGKSNQNSLLLKLLRQDELRVASLNDLLLNSSSVSTLQTTLPARRGTAFGTGNYVISLGIGSPALTQTVIFDTGSSVSWVQCKPFPTCHPQTEPIFDPAASSSYRNLSCFSVGCNLLSRRGCTTSGTCIYQVVYGDGSTTTGFLGQDTLALTLANVFSGFVFGCGQINQGLFGREAGLFGLSRSPLSLISQTSSTFGRVFSYCLPSLSSSTGDLTFGPVSTAVSYTPLVSDPRSPSLYFLQLTSISVGGRVLPVSSTVFSTAGTLIDSGTVITRLPRTAYAALRTAFQSGMTQYSQTAGVSILDTCYDFTGLSTVSVPSVALSYSGGVTVNLKFSNIMILFDISSACLAFAGNADDLQVGIIGNVQQTSQRVVYDATFSRIGFGAATC